MNQTIGQVAVNTAKRVYYVLKLAFRDSPDAKPYVRIVNGLLEAQADTSSASKFESVDDAIRAFTTLSGYYHSRIFRVSINRVEETTTPSETKRVYLQLGDKAPEGAEIKWALQNPWSIDYPGAVFQGKHGSNSLLTPLSGAFLYTSETAAVAAGAKLTAGTPVTRRIALVNSAPQIKRTETILA
jgi:hypothetical protein